LRLPGDRANVVRVIDNLSAGRMENLQRVAKIETVAARALRPPQRRIQLAVRDVTDAELAEAACRDEGDGERLEPVYAERAASSAPGP
jgi:hypothetical protein